MDMAEEYALASGAEMSFFEDSSMYKNTIIDNNTKNTEAAQDELDVGCATENISLVSSSHSSRLTSVSRNASGLEVLMTTSYKPKR